MSEALPVVYLARHGDTAWTVSGQHTGHTDLPLTPEGGQNARRLGERLKGMHFAKVFTSPLARATRTCELAGYGAAARIDPDLIEWDYGKYEGLRSVEILKERPDWQLFQDGCPGGESPGQVGERADRVIERARAIAGNVLLFSSGHFSRVLGARWLGLEPAGGKNFVLSTASLSARSATSTISPSQWSGSGTTIATWSRYSDNGTTNALPHLSGTTKLSREGNLNEPRKHDRSRILGREFATADTG